MKVVIETFVTIIFLSLTVVIASQVILSQMTINEANTFHTNAVKVIEESNFDSNVIEECINEAYEKGFTLEVDVDKEKVLVCSSCNSMWELDTSSICPNCKSTDIYVNQVSSDGMITLIYDISITMLGIDKVGVLQSNAR